MHIPSVTLTNDNILSFRDALAEENRNTDAPFDRNKWFYVPCRYLDYRYILGTRGDNPLICIGINPSTAQPGALDNTLKSVERIASANGYDSFIMFNVCAQRATNPDDMALECPEKLHRENMEAFAYVLSSCRGTPSPSVWAAWGTIIEKRAYLIHALKDMIAIGEQYGANWYSVGKKSKKGHPHHPLYLKKDAVTEPFDVRTYLETLRT